MKGFFFQHKSKEDFNGCALRMAKETSNFFMCAPLIQKNVDQLIDYALAI